MSAFHCRIRPIRESGNIARHVLLVPCERRFDVQLRALLLMPSLSSPRCNLRKAAGYLGLVSFSLAYLGPACALLRCLAIPAVLAALASRFLRGVLVPSVSSWDVRSRRSLYGLVRQPPAALLLGCFHRLVYRHSTPTSYVRPGSGSVMIKWDNFSGNLPVVRIVPSHDLPRSSHSFKT